MSYYIRVLSTSAATPPLATLQAALSQFPATLTCEEGTPTAWTQLTLAHKKGDPIALLEKNDVSPGSLGEEELEEFTEEIADYFPVSAREWLLNFFPRVRCIYAFQVLHHGTEQPGGWDILDTLKDIIFNTTGPAIVQADAEGFSNAQGYHILWQFGEDITGDCWMGVLQAGAWTHFQMDLGNEAHREAFLEGRVPEGVTLAGA